MSNFYALIFMRLFYTSGGGPTTGGGRAAGTTTAPAISTEAVTAAGTAITGTTPAATGGLSLVQI